MKISIGTKIKDGPWGGGNLFALNLSKFLKNEGFDVVFDLSHDDIDLILITEPRKTSESSSFTHWDVENYIKYVKNDTLVCHRINECDERKGTNFVNKYLIEANKVSDTTIFVSSWIKNLYVEQNISSKHNYVILAGADKDIFNPSARAKWNEEMKLRIVTHHWGANWNKGFDVYKKIDEMLNEDFWNKKIDFTYIGNLPKKFEFKNSIHLPPMSGAELAREIKKNHIYITGSLNEPSGNHHIEGAQCGLPIMYIDSGGVKEYTKGFGVEFNIKNLEEKINYLTENYEYYFKKIIDYPFESSLMCSEYAKLFKDMMKNKTQLFNEREIVKANKLFKKTYLFKRNFKYIKK